MGRCFLLFLCFYQIVWISSLATITSSRYERTLKEAGDKFKEFGKRKDALLIIDGNNVRGIARFEWNPVELTMKISKFCDWMGISRIILVWDHGRSKFAVVENELNRETKSQDMVVLFSGTSQRADDVIVRESSFLASNFYNDDWSSLGFVTNDGGLKQRLIRRSGSSCDKRSLIMDSTRFVELLDQCEEVDAQNSSKSALSSSMKVTEKSLKKFAQLQRLGYNPRREKTWERCVLAETLIRTYSQDYNKNDQHPDGFAQQYIQCLPERDFLNPSTMQYNSQTVNSILGPSRLDKRQKRLLARYNKAIHSGLV